MEARSARRTKRFVSESDALKSMRTQFPELSDAQTIAKPLSNCKNYAKVFEIANFTEIAMINRLSQALTSTPRADSKRKQKKCSDLKTDKLPR